MGKKHFQPFKVAFVRVSPREMDWLNRQAAKAGLTQQAYCRQQLGLPIYRRENAPDDPDQPPASPPPLVKTDKPHYRPLR